jgi:hypothetical protein
LTILESGNTGILTIPRKELDVKTVIRSTYTDNSIYADIQCNASGNTEFTNTGTLFDFSSKPIKPKVYTQSAEPDIPSDTFAFWKDSDDSKYYLILDIGGTQKKIELT